MSTLQETKATQPEAAQLVLTFDEPTKGGEFHGAIGIPGGLNPEVSQEAAKSTISAQVSDAEEPAFSVQPFQAIPLADIFEGPTQPPQEAAKAKLKK